MFLGENLLPYLVLAMGAALAVGNLMALLVPRSEPAPADGADAADADAKPVDLARPPLGRSLLMIAIGTVAAVWALLSLMS